MVRYRIFETEIFQEDIARIACSGLDRLKDKLRDHVYPHLRQEPHFSPQIKRLKNWDPPTWRYRVGAWRFFYEIADKEKTVSMTAADHRSSAYR